MNRTDYIECTECHNIVPFDKGIDHDEGFICHICIQNEHYCQLTEFENDPLHKNVPVEDLFHPTKPHLRTFIIAMCLGLIALLTILITILKQGEHDEQTTPTSDYDRKWNQETQENLNRKRGM